MPDPSPSRVALLGFSIECNKFAPPATKAHFTCFAGDDIVAEARRPAPRMLAETPGFVMAMDASGPWIPIGAAFAAAEPNGPVEHGFFAGLLDTIARRLKAALPVDAVYICAHGAALTTEEDDPDGMLFALVREIVGADVPIAATLDLHANVSERMVRSIDAFIGYRTNPHLDMRERGAEAAAAIREMLAGLRPQSAFIRLPIVPPTVTMLTAAGPYAEMIDLGQRRMTPEILNVSVMGGFAFADTAKNGLSVVVTARHDQRAAEALAREIAEFGWANRARFYPRLTALDEAVARALAAGRDPSLPALAFADVADNPGGGGRGNTVFLLRAFHEAGVEGALLGIFYDPPLAAEAHRLGVGAAIRGAVQPRGDDEFLRALHRPGDGCGLDRRGLRRAARHLCRHAGRARAMRGAAGRRHHHRRRLAPGAMRRPGLFRDDGARHRRRALGHGQIARPFPRRLRRVLRPRPGRRGRFARPDLADARPLRLAAAAAPGHPARRQCRVARALGRNPQGRSACP